MSDDKSNANPMWGGHFEKGPHELMEEINASIDIDRHLYRHDIKASIAHAEMLAANEIITQEECKEISEGLKEIEQEITSGKFPFSAELEDIHMNIEARLAEKIGEAAGKLHTARSRNDQVATDFRLYVREALDEVDILLRNLQKSIVSLAEQHADTIMPGFTHLQTAQPTTFAHHLMAYFEMFGRDRRRIYSARAGLNECPLGAAALAGTSFDIDRHMTAEKLDFKGPMYNSIDAVSARDFALEFLGVSSIAATHLSRLAEEMVLWSSPHFGFVVISESFTSGSSIMPQKRNPDAAELIRAKTGRINGALINLLTVMKAIPLAYNKDMQEDKEPVFEAHDQLVICLKVMSGMLDEISVDKGAMKKAAMRGFSTATDIADWLVRKLGLPFREAHHVTGAIVRMAEENDCELFELSLSELQRAHEDINGELFSVLSVDHSVSSRTSFGGTSPDRVRQAIKEGKERYAIS